LIDGYGQRAKKTNFDFFATLDAEVAGVKQLGIFMEINTWGLLSASYI
jgi:hypothetical protein